MFTVAKKIRARRKKAGLKQVEVIRLYNKTEPLYLQLKPNNLSRYERGRSRCFADIYLKIMDVIDQYEKGR